MIQSGLRISSGYNGSISSLSAAISQNKIILKFVLKNLNPPAPRLLDTIAFGAVGNFCENAPLSLFSNCVPGVMHRDILREVWIIEREIYKHKY